MTIQTVTGSTFIDKEEFGYVSLSNLGLIGEVADFTPLILAQLNLGNMLYIPVGEYPCSPMILPANSCIRGEGARSILKLKDNSNQVLMIASSGCELRNFRLDGNKANQINTSSHGLQLLNTVEGSVAGVSVINCKGDGINISGAAVDGLNLTQCSSTGQLNNGIHIESGNNISLNNCRVLNSDPLATGDGIAIVSAGVAITNVSVNNCTSAHNSGRGISVLGSGSRNVKNVIISNPQSYSNSNHGLLILNAENCSVGLGSISNNLADGVRIEGDVQYCRVNDVTITGNTTFGLREVTSGAAPNNNGFIYNNVRGNGTDTITKVGAGSFIV